MLCVLVLAAGAGWESDALARLEQASGVVVLKRCVDVDDLMATAATGQAEAAVVALEAPGLDASALDHLRRHGVRPVAVVADPGRDDAAARLARLDLRTWLAADAMADLAQAVSRAEDAGSTRVRGGMPEGPGEGAGAAAASQGAAQAPGLGPVLGPGQVAGRVVVVWGPPGAPGRTTLATAVAAELARRGSPTLLVDADPVAASVAQHLGVLDQVSGVLAAARLAVGADLQQRLPSACRTVAPHLAVMTGLPRPDRWVEVRPGAMADVLDAARSRGNVVVDTGPELVVDPGLGAPAAGPAGGRNTMTVEALEAADEVLVVGSADPVGLSRLARGLVELHEVVPGTPVRVVVNRMRSSLGWSEAQVAGMVEGFARVSALHFLPDDRTAVDRSLVAGRALGETGDSALARAVAGLTDAVLPATVGSGGRSWPRRRLPGPRVRQRTAGTARPR